MRVLAIAFLILLWATRAAGEPTLLQSWGSRGSDPGQIWYARRIATDASGDVFVGDVYNYRVQRFSSSGVFELQWAFGDQHFDQPSAIAVSPSGEVFVGAYSGIYRFAVDGQLLSTWASTNAKDLEFDRMGKIYTLNFDGFVYVYSNQQALLRVVSPNAAGLNSGASCVAADDDGNIYIGYAHHIAKFDAQGNYVLAWGGDGSGPGEFDDWVNDIEIDAQGNIYAADNLGLRVSKFTPVGGLVEQWSLPCAPMSLALADGDRVLFVSCFSSIHKYGWVGTSAAASTWGSVKARYR